MKTNRSQPESNSQAQSSQKEGEIPLIPKRRSSLRLKASLIGVAISAIPIILLGIATYQINKQTVDRQIKQNQESTAEIFADEISNFLLERYGDIKNLSKQAIFIDSKLRNLTDVKDKERYLNLYLSFAQGIYNNIIFLDFESDSIAIAGEKNGIVYQKKEKYFNKAISSDVFISQPKKNSRGEMVIVISAPVKDSISQKIIGIVKTSIPVYNIKKIITNHERAENIYLVDREKLIFISSDPEIQNNFEEEHVGVNLIFPELINQQDRLPSSLGVLDNQKKFNGEDILIAYAAIPQIEKLPNLGWHILIETQTGEIFKTQYEIRIIFIVGTLITLAIVGIITTIVANLSIKPIKKITAAVEKITKGDLGIRLKITGSDEIAILAANTNQMANKIERLIKTERENAEKSSERNHIVANLLNLILNEVLLEENVQEIAKEFTKASAKTLQVETVSIWLYNESQDTLTCLDRYLKKQQEHIQGEIIQAEQFPNYFQDLAEEELVKIEDRLDRPAIVELIDRDQIEPQTTAMLNIPIRTAGCTVGILRCEQTEKPRKWSKEDLSFTHSLAGLISLALESEYLQNEVEHLLEVVCSIEDGDLTARAKVSERVTGLVADTLNRLSEQITRIMLKLLQTARELQQNSARQKAIASKLTNNTDRQAREQVELVKLNELVEQTTQGFSNKIQQSNKSLLVLENTIKRGQELLVNLTADIDTLDRGTDRIVQQTKTLGEFLTVADRFVQDQSQIASLTQVLAMNASLVAARAAQQKDPAEFALVSRQFESIAERVSGLAEKTNQGLVTLEQPSAEIRKAVSGVDLEVKNLSRLVRGFSKTVEKSSEVFANLETETAIVSTSDLSALESSRSIIKATRSMTEVMQNSVDLAAETVKLSKQTKTESETIEVLAKQLLQTIEFFQLAPLREKHNSRSGKNPQNLAEKQFIQTSSEETSISSLT